MVSHCLGFHSTVARITHLSPQFVTAHRIFADFSAICYGSVITTVQSLLQFFLHDLFSPRFPLVAWGLRRQYDLVPHRTGDFLLFQGVSLFYLFDLLYIQTRPHLLSQQFNYSTATKNYRKYLITLLTYCEIFRVNTITDLSRKFL